jgi:hypothetical protein
MPLVLRLRPRPTPFPSFLSLNDCEQPHRNPTWFHRGPWYLVAAVSLLCLGLALSQPPSNVNQAAGQTTLTLCDSDAVRQSPPTPTPSTPLLPHQAR